MSNTALPLFMSENILYQLKIKYLFSSPTQRPFAEFMSECLEPHNLRIIRTSGSYSIVANSPEDMTVFILKWQGVI